MSKPFASGILRWKTGRKIMDDQIMVSIIVPVYNAAAHLEGCVDSILAQTLSAFELILVDDGSDDGSGALCDGYAADPRVKVLHKKNGGPGQARNYGIDAARGQYIGFADADDSVDQNFFKTLYDTAVCSGADLAFCDYAIRTKAGDVYVQSDLSGDRDYTKKEINALMLPYFFGYADREIARYKTFCPFADYSSYVWLGLYKATLFDGRKLRFLDQGQYYNEDHLFNLSAVFFAQKITHVAKALYFYNDCDNSLTKRYNPDFLQAKINRYAYLRKFIDDNGIDKDFCDRLDNKICVESINIINYYAGAQIPLAEKYARIRQTIGAPTVARALERLDLRYLPPSKLLIFLRLEKLHACRILLLLSLGYGLVRR
jgi:glycosyltransferase involved in cell wall biosynthesis